MKALLPNPARIVCRRWKPVATLALSLSAVWPAWAAAPFTVNGNGTVTDAVTSLVWDQCIVGRTGSDCATDDAVLARLYTWSAALAAATAANAANYKGFSDWRVPNVKELESITKLDTWTSGQATIDAEAFPNTPIGGDDWGGGATWTSTTFTPNPDFAWVVDFGNGYPVAVNKTNSDFVRLVRSGQSLASFEYLSPSTPPVNTAGPTVSSAPTASTASISVTLDEAGTGYWLLVPASAAAPTPAQVVAGVNYGAVTVSDAGRTTMTAATPASISLTGLSSGTGYMFYFVAKDVSDTLQTAPASVLVFTHSPLNDTGQTQCADASDALVSCDAATTGDAGTRPRQDGRFGRDVATPAKVGAGLAGFDFSRVCFNGDIAGTGTCTGTLLANTTATATASAETDWACTRDNVTGLFWSLESGQGDWTTFAKTTLPTTTNAASRCGFNSGWRLPTRRELQTLAHRGLTTGPMIDADYFPATQSAAYWVSEAYARVAGYAWYVDFGSGKTNAADVNTTDYVRLVHSHLQPPTSLAWANAEGYVPIFQGYVETGMILAGNRSFSGATGLTLISVGGGTIGALSVNSGGQLVFDYTAPYADLDTLRLTGTDRYGNAIAIDLRVDLPYLPS